MQPSGSSTALNLWLTRRPPTGHHRRPRFVSACHPGSARAQGATSLQRVPQPSHRAGSPRNQTAALSDAGLRRVSVGPALLPGLRGSSTVLSTPSQTQPSYLARPRQTTVPVQSTEIGIPVPHRLISDIFETPAANGLSYPVPSVLTLSKGNAP